MRLESFKMSLASAALSLGCSSAVGSSQEDASLMKRDVGNQDVSQLPYTLDLNPSAHRVLANRTFAVVAFVRQGARLVVNHQITLTVSEGATLVHGNSMQTICTGIPNNQDVLANNDQILRPGSDRSNVGRVLLTNNRCPAGFEDSGLQIALLHTQMMEPTELRTIRIIGIVGGLAPVAQAETTISLTTNVSPSAAFLMQVLSPVVSPSAGQNFSTVVLPLNNGAYGLSCLPDISTTNGEDSEQVGCTAVSNGGRLAAGNESIAINQQLPAMTAGALLLDPSTTIFGCTIHSRGLGADALNDKVFTHLGGNAYIMTTRAGVAGDLASWGINLRDSRGQYAANIIQRVAIR